ncbi:MAG: glycosyltransferase family 1 protein [Planctomycetia bacterium]|nr:glycosyltransferase family 1 protein [Planctomycetia bacterium]
MSSGLRILLVYDCLYPASLGGVEYRNHCLARALAARGHHVGLAGWGDASADGLPAGVVVVRLPYAAGLHGRDGKRGILPTLRFAAAMLRLDVAAYDVVETANIPYLHVFLLAMRCRLARKPLIVSWYEFFGPYWRAYKGGLAAPLFRGIEWLTAQLGDRVNASCERTRLKLAAARRRKAADPPLLPCGVWLADVQRVLELPAVTAPQLLYAGRLIPEKRLDLLLRAVALLPPPAGAVTQLGIVGDGTERQALEALSRELGLEHRVRFFGRLPAIEEMWRLLAHAELALQPSQREGFGLFPLEALALGKPVIYCAAEENAIGDVVRHEREGLCSRPTPEALAAAIARLLDDPLERAEFSRRARERAADYDWPAVARQAEALFLSLGSTAAPLHASGPLA